MGKHQHNKSEYLFRSLCTIGVHAQLAERGRPEEHYRFDSDSGKCGESLGLIDIAQSPIGWVNLAKDYIDGVGTIYETIYGVPDSRNLPRLRIRAVRNKSFTLLGKVIEVRWRPIDDYGIAHVLTNDSVIRTSIMKSGSVFSDPHVISYGTGYWLITGGIPTYWEPIPSLEQWLLYETIAKRLLAIHLIL